MLGQNRRHTLPIVVLFLCLVELEKVLVRLWLVLVGVDLLLSKYIVITLHKASLEQLFLLLVLLLHLVLLVLDLAILCPLIIIFFFQGLNLLDVVRNYICLFFSKFIWVYIRMVNYTMCADTQFHLKFVLDQRLRARVQKLSLAIFCSIWLVGYVSDACKCRLLLHERVLITKFKLPISSYPGDSGPNFFDFYLDVFDVVAQLQVFLVCRCQNLLFGLILLL